MGRDFLFNFFSEDEHNVLGGHASEKQNRLSKTLENTKILVVLPARIDVTMHRGKKAYISLYHMALSRSNPATMVQAE